MHKEHDLLDTPDAKKSWRTFPEETSKKVNYFCRSEDVWRIMVGKNILSLLYMKKSLEGEFKNKRQVLCYLYFAEVKTQQPEIKIGFSRFEDCVLEGGSGTHSVGVCMLQPLS